MTRKAKTIRPTNLSGKQFKALIENAHEGIVLYDAQGLIKYVTPAVSKITGFRLTEIIGKSGIHFLHPDDVLAATEGFFNLTKKKGKSITLFQRIRHKKGYYIWSESRLTNFSHVPEINGVVSNFRDITESRRSEEKAAKTQELLATVNRNLSEGIFMGIVGKEFIYVNEAFLLMTGFRSFNELRHFKPEVIFSNLTEQKKIVKSLKSASTLSGVEVLLKTKNGKEFWGVLNVRLLRHEGRANYFVGTIRDITTQKEAGQLLMESRNFLDNIINTVAAPIFVKDDKNRLVTLNTKFCEFVGRPKKDITRQTCK
jgi:PAS domain S-box-containing protein